MTMHRVIILLFVITAFLGVAIAVWSGLGDSSVIATTGGVYETLRTHGQSENAALRNDLYQVVLRLQWPWAVAQWLGIGMAVLSAIGVVVVWRNPHE